MFNQYPYINLNDINLDYILKAIKDMRYDVTNFVAINAIKYANPIQWDITSQYEKNTIVIDPQTGTAYISVAPVPAGVALSRPEYWTVVFDLQEFITKANQNIANNYEVQTTTTATMNTAAGDWVIWNEVLYKALVNITAGDAYIVGSNIRRITVEDVVKAILQDIADEVQARQDADDAINATIGDLNDLATSDKSSVVNAINETVNNVGDLNDLATSDKSSIVKAINEEVQARQDADGNLQNNISDILNGTTPFSVLNAPNTLKFAAPTAHSRYFDYVPYTDPNGVAHNLLTAGNDIDFVGAGMYVNVLLFGADNTGATETSQAIQDAIDHATSLPTGGVVYLPAGTYKISSALRLKDKVSILGDGIMATTIMADTTSVGIDAHGSAIGGCFIKGLRIWRDTPDTSPGYPALLTKAGILFGCTVDEYNQAIFKIEDVSIRNFTVGISGGYHHGTANAIGLFDSILDNVWCVDCTWAGIALGGSGNQIRHPRIVNCATGIAFIRISDESFDGDLILGGIFISNGYDITFRDAGLYRPIRFINTWFEQSTGGIINVPFAIRVMNLGFEGCMFNSNTTQYDTFSCGLINAGIVQLLNCTAYQTVAGGNNNITLPATTTGCKGVAVNCVKIASDGTFMIYEDLT